MPEFATSRLRSNSRFGLVWAATAISGLGDGLVFVAFPLLMAESTDDPRLTAAVVVAARLPWILVSLPVGALVDRHQRRTLLVMAEVGRALLLGVFGVLALAGSRSVPLILFVVFLVGVGETVFVSGSHAALPTVVGPGQLAQANGALYAVQTATENMIGPALGGLLFGVGVALPFIIDGASFALSAVLLFLAVPIVASRLELTDRRVRDDMRDGIRYFKGQPALRSLVVVITSLAFCQSMVFGVVVLFARDVLGLSSGGFGLFVAVAAIGALVGGAVAGRLDLRFGPRVLVPAAAVVAAIGYLLVGLATNPLAAGAAFAAEAVAVAVGNVSSTAFRQRTVPSELLGRIGNIYRFFIYGATPLGALVGGFVAHATSLRWPFFVAAAVQLVATATLAPTLSRRMAFAMAGASS